MLFKNNASQGVYVFAKDTTTGAGKTGDAANITAAISKDGAAGASTNDVNPTEIGGGIYWFDLTQAETNADAIGLYASSTTSNVVIDPLIILTTAGAVPKAAAGGNGGLPTVDATNRVAGVSGNVAGSVASVTGAVGSVTGNVGGNVTGSVGSVVAVVNANAVQISGDTTAANNLEADYDGTGYAKAASSIGSVSGAVGSVTGAVASVTGNVGGNVTGSVGSMADNGASLSAVPWNASWDAEVQSECNDAMVALNLDHLLSAAATGLNVANNSVVAQLVSKSATADWDDYDNTTDSLQAVKDTLGSPAGASVSVDIASMATDVGSVLNDTANMQPKLGTITDLGGGATVGNNLSDMAGATFATGTDSLEAIRDRGDAAWTTGGGGSITDILNVQPVIPTSIDLADTATVRIGLMLTNAVDDLPSTAEITPGTISIDRKASGGTSWSAVVTDAACSEQAGLVYYDEVFDAGSGYAAGDSIRVTFKSQKITVAANDYEVTDSNGVSFQTSIRGSDLTSIKGTAVTETTAGRLAANVSTFFDNADAETTKTVDDVGTAGTSVSVTSFSHVFVIPSTHEATNTARAILRKQVAEKLRVAVDFSSRIADGNTIASSAYTEDETGAVESGTTQDAGTRVYFWLDSGVGAAGTRVRIQWNVTDSQSQVHSGDCLVDLVET